MKKLVSLLLVFTMMFSTVMTVSAQEYTVEEGDVLWRIARDYDTTIDALVEVNDIENRNLIYVDQVLTIPEVEEIAEAEAKAIDIEVTEAETTEAVEPVAYNVISRVNGTPDTVELEPSLALTSEDDLNENVALVVERVLNDQSFMLKKGTVQPVSVEGSSSWELLCDEGGTDSDQTAPNPLTYLTTGITSNLLTQVQKGIEVMDLEVDSVRVEAEVAFSYDNAMSADWVGYTDSVKANIVIESDETEEVLIALQEMALNAWVAGEGLANETPIYPELIINGEYWDEIASLPGGVVGDVSIVDDLKVTDRTTELEPLTIVLGEELPTMEVLKEGVGPNGFDMEFVVVAIAEMVEDPDRPYLQEVKVHAIQEHYIPWTLYVDDSIGNEGEDKAPSSLDYLTAGTGLCLTSQLSALAMSMQEQLEDYRVEQEINFRQENTMTEDMAGYTDSIVTYIIVNGQAPDEAFKEFSNLALQMCFAGESFLNETEMINSLYVNGEIVE